MEIKREKEEKVLNKLKRQSIMNVTEENSTEKQQQKQQE